MTNYFKNNSLASFLLGFIIGAGAIILGQFLFATCSSASNKTWKDSTEEVSVYDQIKEDSDGEVYITSKGGKYHHSYCKFLQHAHRIKQVRLHDAQKYGYSPCSKCY